MRGVGYRGRYHVGVALAIGSALIVARPVAAQTDAQVALSLGNSFFTNNQTYVDASPFVWPTAAPASEGLDATILNSGSTVLGGDSKSASFLVVRGGTLVHESYFHGATAASAKNIHSGSKSFLSALTGIAIKQGLLTLNTRIGDVLPQTMPAAKQSITVQNLLTMTSGIGWNEDVTEYNLDSNFVQSILNLPQSYAPGTQYNYSTGDAYLLGAVLAQASGQSLHQFAKQRLFDPLGIDVERWGRDNQGYFSGGANFYITPREMAKFGELYLDGGAVGGNQIVPSSWVAASTTSQGQVSYYGYMWWNDVNLDGYHGYRAWGWGKQFIYVFPTLDMVVTITHDTNGNVSDTDLNSFVRDYVIHAVTGPAAISNGDFDGDGDVDAADYTMWRDGLGTRYTNADFAMWKANFGRTNLSGAGQAATVPEPAAILLMLVGCAGLRLAR